MMKNKSKNKAWEVDVRNFIGKKYDFYRGQKDGEVQKIAHTQTQLLKIDSRRGPLRHLYDNTLLPLMLQLPPAII